MSRRVHRSLLARRPNQRGSALLIVFVFAAIVAIMLYSELPIAVFEAKRQKEQLLIDRGNEYAHAVKLYVRKFGSYPATVEQLEDTNRMRFLRHRYKDPFTGKENWRMLHAGPGGQLIDSKVKPLGLGTMPGSNSNSGSSFGSANNNSSSGATASTASSGFGSSGFGQSAFGQSGFGSNASGAQETVVPDVPQRPPAISSNGTPGGAGGTGENAGAQTEGDQSPTASLVPEVSKDPMNELAQSGPQTGNPAAGGAEANGANGGGATAAGQNVAGQNAGTGGQNPTGQNAMDTVRKMLNNPAIGAPLAGSGSTGSTMGQISGGGIAGVASNAKGHAIKVVNDQTDYSLWEFYYDPTKDAAKNLPGANGAQGTGQPGNGMNAGPQSGSNQSIFGQQQNGAQSGSGGTSAAPTNPQN